MCIIHLCTMNKKLLTFLNKEKKDIFVCGSINREETLPVVLFPSLFVRTVPLPVGEPATLRR